MLFKRNQEKPENENKFSERIITLSSLKKSFNFHPCLDVDYLHDFHGNDWEQVLFAFELFLDITVKDAFKLNDALRKQEMKTVLALIHKVRPGFMMVGLSSFDIFFDNLKRKEFQESDETYVSHVQAFWWNSFLEQLEIIQSERTRLELFVQKNKSTSK